MKKQTTFATSMLLGILIALSVLNSTPTVVGVHVPSDVIHTGDKFTFDESGTETETQRRFFQMWDYPSVTFRHGDDEFSEYKTIYTGTSDVGFIRQTPNMPNLGEMDTLVRVRSDQVSQPGSYRTDYSNHTSGDPVVWDNPVPNYQTTDGQHNGNDNDQAVPLSSNSTYAVIFPEFDQPSFNIYDQNNGGGNGYAFGNFAAFDGYVPRTEYFVTSGSLTTNINSVAITLSTTIVNVTWSGLWTQTTDQPLTLGPEGESPAGVVSVVDTLYISISNTYVYDSSNTLLVQTNSVVKFDYSSIIAYNYYGFTYPDSTPVTFYIQSDFTSSRHEIRSSTVSAADSFYGNTRPISSGTPRLMAGDVMKYDFSESRSIDAGFSSHSDTYNNFKDESGNVESREVSDGLITFDIFRNSPTSWESVLIMDAIGSGNFTSQDYSNINGTVDNPPADTHNYVNEHRIGYDLMEFMSNTNFDIMAFFDDNKWVDTKILYDDCQNGNDCFNVNVPNNIQKIGLINTTSYYINLLDQKDGPGYLEINGFNYWEFNATEMTQHYRLSDISHPTMWVGGQDGGPQFEISLVVNITANARQSFYYDADTGAMIAMDDETEVNLHITSSDSIAYTDESGTHTYNFNLDMHVHWDEHFTLFLSEHPTLYKTAPTPPPTSSPPSSSTTAATTPTSSEPVSSGNSSADLPLPLPITPILLGLFSIGVIVRKRK